MKKYIILLMALFFCGICIGKNEVMNMESEYKIVECDETNNVCIIRNKYLKYGLSDKDFNIVLPVEYQSIVKLKDDENYRLDKKGLQGIANPQGRIILEPIYRSIKPYSDIKNKYKIVYEYKNGLADMKTGHIDIEPIYDWFFTYENGDIHIEKNDKIGVMNKAYKVIVPTEYESAYLFNGNKYYRLEKQIEFINKEGLKETVEKYGIVDLNGKFIIPPECEWIDKGIPSYKYAVIKNGENYIFDSLSGKLERNK